MRTQTHECKFISQVRAQHGSQGGGEVSVHRPRGLESWRCAQTPGTGALEMRAEHRLGTT